MVGFFYLKEKYPLGKGGIVVRPLGLEPRLDSVGGCNVIQLHYEYIVFYFETVYP